MKCIKTISDRELLRLASSVLENFRTTAPSGSTCIFCGNAYAESWHKLSCAVRVARKVHDEIVSKERQRLGHRGH